MKKRWVIIGLALLTVLSIFALIRMTGWENNTVLSPFSAGARQIITPLQKGLTLAVDGLDDFFGYFANNKALRKQNEEMAQEIAKLREQIYSLQEMELENKRYSVLLDYMQAKIENYDLVLAGVIGRDPGNWYKTITINRGAKDGIQPKMTVVNHHGLVGTVLSVTEDSAEVMLILDNEGAVGGRIFENRVTPGIVVGNGHSDLLRLINIPHDVPLEAGQTVVSSGLGGIYPKGIRIGTITVVKPTANGLMKTAEIQPFVDFSRLEEVFVIKNVKKQEADGVDVLTGTEEKVE